MKKSIKKAFALTLALIMVFGSAPLAGLDLFGVNAKAASYQVGDHIYFGSYPQSEVKDEAMLSELNSSISSYDWNEDWISYGYYSGDGSYGTMVQGDWMKYADTTYNGNKYRAVKFTQYRSYRTEHPSSAGNSYQDDNGYVLNTIYWFKYEPIEWRVLDPANGLVMAETCIDSQAFSNTIYQYGTDPNGNDAYWNDEAHTHYESDYATSSIRKWLNDDFYNTAFNETQKSQIATTTLDNSSPYSSTYDSVTTNDNVFLLSYYDLINSAYGFSSDKDEDDVARRAKSTDYAKAQGCYQNTSSSYAGNADWWLRSPGLTTYSASYVHNCGYVYSYRFGNSGEGVRPALTLNLNHGFFAVTWNVDGVETVVDYEYGATIVRPSDPTKEGYTFKGWNPEIPSTMPANNLTFNAIWEVNTYKVKWIVDGVETVENYEYGTNIVKPANPTIPGYTFKGWNTEIPETMPANDLTIFAELDCVTTIKINNNPGTKTINYGEGINFTATATDMPDGAKIVWYINGTEKGTGESFTFSNATADTTITVKVVDKNGNVLKDATDGEISASEKITVKAGFFQKLISFFKNLFKVNRIVAQSIDSKKAY